VGGPECGRPWSVLLPEDARLALRFAAKLVTRLSTPAICSCRNVCIAKYGHGAA